MVTGTLLRTFLLLTIALPFLTGDWVASGFGQGGWYGTDSSAPSLPIFYEMVDLQLSNPTAESNSLATGLKESLNALWDPSWNCFAAFIKADAGNFVLYGYAFRHHWVWHNDYHGLRVSFVVWKDYNCQTEVIFRSNQIFIGDFSKFSIVRDIISSYELDPTPNIWQILNFVGVSYQSANPTQPVISMIGFDGWTQDVAHSWTLAYCGNDESAAGKIPLLLQPNDQKYTVIFLHMRQK